MWESCTPVVGAVRVQGPSQSGGGCRVSVVIPVHNREDVLAETLESVRAQSLPDWECIVIDDRSDDGSHELAQIFARLDPRFKAVRLPAGRRHQCAARNFGLSLARGEFVNFLDSDDLFAVDKLRAQVEQLESRPEADVSLVLYAAFDSQSRTVTSVRHKIASGDAYLDAVLNQRDLGFVMNTITPLWRSSALRSIGGWSEDRRFYEDSELGLRAILNGAPLARIERVLAFVRSGRKRDAQQQEKGPPEADALMIAHNWGLLSEAGQATAWRRRVLATRILRRATSIRRQGFAWTALVQWLRASQLLGCGVRMRVSMALALFTPVGISERLLQALLQGAGGSGRPGGPGEIRAVLLSEEGLKAEARRELDQVLAASTAMTK